ncbi:hypothetical protein GCM10011575_03890 [Microlunatus endophyticus]|uniref:Uncharacterized protein n=1 Tax=Microlunatus endophyticus TaxID=1716077 RepID=A0A917S1Q0_9ACTN|nr:hypothetical protein [Microlunatus endophyticus]GGL49024.1 hypothetical protein GCM10011575_03890 [Microlunatus endophyticus]
MTRSSESAMDWPEDDPIEPITAIERASHVTTVDDLRRRWRSLMGDGGFGRTSLWIIWFDERGQQLPVVVPIDDLPAELEPDGVDNLIMIIGSPAELGAASVALLLSRPGPGSVIDEDRRRANQILAGVHRAQQRGALELKVWPLHLATTDSVRQLPVDDLL